MSLEHSTYGVIHHFLRLNIFKINTRRNLLKLILFLKAQITFVLNFKKVFAENFLISKSFMKRLIKNMYRLGTIKEPNRKNWERGGLYLKKLI